MTGRSGADGEIDWNVPSERKPPGGTYEGLAIWANSARVHEVGLELLQRHRPPPARVIDVGAGSGAFTRRMLDHGYESVEAIEMRAEEFGVEGVPVHPLDLDGRFGESGLEPADAAVALEVIEHMENPWAFGRQLGRLVRPGGWLILSTPNIESARSRIEFLLKGEFRFFDRESYDLIGHKTALMGRMIRHVFDEAGFDLVERAYDLDKGPRRPTSSRKAHRWLLHRLSAPFMRGDSRGEIGIFAFRRRT